MANDIVNIYSDALFNVYNKSNVPSKKGAENGWPYYQTETLLKIFQEAAEPHVGRTTESAAPASSPPPTLQSHPSRLQSVWPILVGAVVVVGCVLALAWQAHRQALERGRLQQKDTEIAKMWDDTAQQLMQSQLTEAGVLNSNQTALAASQAEIGAGLVRLSDIDKQLAVSASSQAVAIRDLAAAHTALTQETTNLGAFLSQTFQQGLAEASRQHHADIGELQAHVQAHVVQETTNLGAFLSQSFQQGLAETARQNHADIGELQARIAQETTNMGASLSHTFQRGMAEAARQNHADISELQARIAQEATNMEASLRHTFHQGIAEAARQNHADIGKLQTQVAEGTTNLETSLRQTFQQGLSEVARQNHADAGRLQTQVAEGTTNLETSLRQTFQQGLSEVARQNHADVGKLQTQVAEGTTNLETSLRRTFQQGLARAARQNRADTEKFQSQVAEETAKLEASLRQTFEQGLAKAARQNRAESEKFQTQVAEETAKLEASLRQIFEQGLAKAARQSAAETEKLQTQVADVASHQKALLDRLSKPATVPRLALDLPGVTTTGFGTWSLITFDEGLFLQGTYFKPDAKSRLQALATALAKLSTPVRIEVIGCADHDLAFKIGGADKDLALRWTERFEESLALDRASAVVDYFTGLGLFVPNRVTALTSPNLLRPFPGDTAESRAKNRTVVLRISTEAKPMPGYVEAAR